MMFSIDIYFVGYLLPNLFLIFAEEVISTNPISVTSLKNNYKFNDWKTINGLKGFPSIILFMNLVIV